ncbi:GNAT family N-acetyltransferase [Rahnella selenatireducens]|uniref:GNAT family N-acetyltransferase n=1 Tax=Rahnella selenatireducens TaxID=3389797 RepID=UPI00396867EC
MTQISSFTAHSTLKIVSLADVPQYLDVVTEYLHGEWSDFPHWAQKEYIRQRLIQRMNSRGRQCVLIALDEDEQVVGTAGVMRYELSDVAERKYWLGEVFTPRHLRGKGIGTALVKACISRSRDAGLETLWLYTPDQQGLYGSLGWQEVENREVDNEQVTVMQRSLS